MMTQQIALLSKMYSTSASTATAVMIEQDEQQQQQHQPVAAFRAYHHHLSHPGEYPRHVTAAAAPSPSLPPPPPTCSSSQSHANSPIPYDSSMTLYYNEEQETEDLLVSWNFADLGLEIPKDDADEGEEEDEDVAVTASPPAVDSAVAPAVPVTPSGSSTNSSDSINGSNNSHTIKKQQQQPASVVTQKCINSLRRAGKKKPPGSPKRPLSAYNIFFKNERPKVLHEMLPGTVSFEQLGKLIGERWRCLSQDQRKIYEQHAYKDVLRYRKQMDHFEDIRRQRYRCQPYYPCIPPQQHPVVVSYDRNMMMDIKDKDSNSTLPCVVSFEEAVQAAANNPLPIIHDAPPPLYQLPPTTTDAAQKQQQRDCHTPSCSPEPTSTNSATTMISPYRITSCLSTTATVTSTTAGYTKGGGDQAQQVPPVTPPTPRPVVQQQQQQQTIHAPHSPHYHRQVANNSMLDPINFDDVDDDSPIAAAVYSYSYQYPNYLNCSNSSPYQYPVPPRYHLLPHHHAPDEEQHQLVLPKPPGRCLGGPPEHIAIPQGMDVYLPTTRTVMIPSLAASSTASTATVNHGRHDKSNNFHHHHGQQQQMIITGRRKYKVYYSAYRMKRSEADDYLKRLSDTLASWNTSVSATMASPTDSFVLNDDNEMTTNHHDVKTTTTTTNRETIVSAAAAAAAAATAPPHSPRPPLMPPALSHGGPGASAAPAGYVPYHDHHHHGHDDHDHDNNDHSYGAMRHDSRRYS